MGDFRSFLKNKRVPAIPMEPVIDPAGWPAHELEDVSSWSYRLSNQDIDELAAGVAAVKKAGVPISEVTRKDFPLKGFGDTLRDIRSELIDGRGIVMMQGFPVTDFNRESQAIAYLGLGTYLGRTLSQNAQGHVLGHVKDLGGDYNDRNTRSYVTRAELRFHCDSAEYVGLLCLQTAKEGGQSRIASSVTAYNKMLKERPDCVKLLLEDWYYTRSGELQAGELPYYKQPIFAFVDGYFSASSIGAITEKAQGVPGVPLWTDAQKECVKVYQQTVADCAVDIQFQQGDIQFLNNHVMLHSRREYWDWPEDERKRHLLRLWLYDAEARPIPSIKREGRGGSGVNLKGVKPNAPLNVYAMAD